MAASSISDHVPRISWHPRSPFPGATPKLGLSRAMSVGRKLGCQTCRDKHLKCDKAEPTCSRCAQSGIECIRSFNLRFKHDGLSRNFSSGSSPGGTKTGSDDGEYSWVRVPRKLSFINQTREVMATYGLDMETGSQLEEDIAEDDVPDGNQSQSCGSATGIGPVPEMAPATANTPSSNQAPPVHSPPVVQSSATLESPLIQDIEMHDQSRSEHYTNGSHTSPSIAEVTHADGSDIMQSGNEISPSLYHDFSSILLPNETTSQSFSSPDKSNVTCSVFYEQSESPFTPSGMPIAYASPGVLFTEKPIWPLKSSREAHLMRFYLDKIAPAIDLCDRDRHFTLVVPQRASQCPTLLNAIFAASARHLSSISDYDPLISNRYNQECLNHLIPKLCDTEAIMDENLLAATVILRHLEELELSVTGSDAENHLQGARLLMSAQEHHRALAGGLRKAVYWFGLRQEIYVSFIKQRPLHDSFKRSYMDIPVNPVDDFDWANVIIARTGEVIQFCFDESEHSIANYDLIVQHFDAWFLNKPESYMPIFSAEMNAQRIFPELWYLNDAVITGLQHYHLGRVLLAVYNPRIPRLGIAHRNSLREVGETLKEQIKIICGIAMSNRSISASYTHATMMIAMGGDRFTDRREQEALFDILITTQRDFAWPTQTVQEHLKEAWGW